MQYPQVYVTEHRQTKLSQGSLYVCLMLNNILEEFACRHKIQFEREVDAYSDDMDD